MEDDLKFFLKKWKTTLKKIGRTPQNKLKNGKRPQVQFKKNQP